MVADYTCVLKVYLATPRPIPETMIGNDPLFFFDTSVRLPPYQIERRLMVRRVMKFMTKTRPDSAKLNWVNDVLDPLCDIEKGLDRIAGGCEDVSHVQFIVLVASLNESVVSRGRYNRRSTRS